MRILNKYILIFFALFVFAFPCQQVFAQLLSEDTVSSMEWQEEELAEEAGFESDADLGSTASTIIEAFLGFLGIIFLVLIIYAGFVWMTAAGDSDKVQKAKDTIFRSVIGLVIIVLSYSITYFVFRYL